MCVCWMVGNIYIFFLIKIIASLSFSFIYFFISFSLLFFFLLLLLSRLNQLKLCEFVNEKLVAVGCEAILNKMC